MKIFCLKKVYLSQLYSQLWLTIPFLYIHKINTTLFNFTDNYSQLHFLAFFFSSA